MAISPGISQWDKEKTTARAGTLAPGKGFHTDLTVRAPYRTIVKPDNDGPGWAGPHSVQDSMLQPMAPCLKS